MTRDELKEELRVAINTTRVLADIKKRKTPQCPTYRENPSYEEQIVRGVEAGKMCFKSTLTSITIVIRDRRGFMRVAHLGRLQVDRAWDVLEKHCPRLPEGGRVIPYTD